MYTDYQSTLSSILTATLKNELQLNRVYRSDQAPDECPYMDWRLKNEIIPGSLVCFGEFKYEREADGKIYVFPVRLILTKEYGDFKILFWLYNSYTGVRREELNIKNNLEEQIGLILLERAGCVNNQFIKNPGTPFRTTVEFLAWACWTAMLVGASMAFYAVWGRNIIENTLNTGKIIAEYGFFGNLVVLPLSVIASLIERKKE